MRIKALHIVSAFSFIALAQLLFFWIVPISNSVFVAVYPFYTVLTTAHTFLLAYICAKYKYPASFAPSFCGSIVAVGEMVTGLLLGSLCTSIRTALFVQAIITVVYVLVMAVFCSTAAKESVDSDIPVAPVRPYNTNSEPSPVMLDTPAPVEVSPALIGTPPARKPKPANVPLR